MDRHHVATLVFDEHNLREMARHGVSDREAAQLVWNRHVVAANPRGEPSSVLLIGVTNGGRCLTVPLAPTRDPTTWRPATGFDASRHQQALFDRSHS